VGNVAGTPLLSSNGELRGEKGGLFEGGIRVPAFANWPAKLKPHKVSSVMHAVDWMPTLTKLVGYTPSSDLKWDGRDVWPLVTGAVTKAEPRTLYIALPGGAALRDGDWKLIATKDNRKLLFNLADDPYEKTDLASKEPQRVEKLVAQLAKMREQDRPSLPEDLVGIKD
jgi:arylsulfatase A-like enzyme